MKEIEDYKLWCKQNDLKENSYKSLRLYLAGKAIMQLFEELAQAFMDVHIKEHNYELLYAIDCIVEVAKEETDEPGYMLEKLNQAKRYLDAAIRTIQNNV